MSKEQIEEMAELICNLYAHGKCTIDGFICNHNCEYKRRAEDLYNAGYRKQREWISVEERLPEGKTPILVTDGAKVIVAYRNWLYRSNGTGKLRCPANYGNGMYVTHWMPLPEPPKMRKEDEGK